jgi:hypothetical protein
MDPTQPDAGAPGHPEDEFTRAERGPTNLGAADPLSNTRPGPVLAYVRPANPAPAVEKKPRSVWPRRLMLIIFVVFCMEVGIMLAVLPWKQLWVNNPLVLRFPQMRAILGNFFVRGMFSGLGLIDLFIGIWEAVHYSEE